MISISQRERCAWRQAYANAIECDRHRVKLVDRLLLLQFGFYSHRTIHSTKSIDRDAQIEAVSASIAIAIG